MEDALKEGVPDELWYASRQWVSLITNNIMNKNTNYNHLQHRWWRWSEWLALVNGRIMTDGEWFLKQKEFFFFLTVTLVLVDLRKYLKSKQSQPSSDSIVYFDRQQVREVGAKKRGKTWGWIKMITNSSWRSRRRSSLRMAMGEKLLGLKW